MTNRFKNISKNISNIKKYFVTVTELGGTAVCVLGPRLNCPQGPLSHLVVQGDRRGGPGRADLRLTSALALGSLASPQLLADLVSGVAGGSHH